LVYIWKPIGKLRLSCCIAQQVTEAGRAVIVAVVTAADGSLAVAELVLGK